MYSLPQSGHVNLYIIYFLIYISNHINKISYYMKVLIYVSLFRAQPEEKPKHIDVIIV